MSDDSTRIKTHKKVVGLHYNDFQCPAPCNDSASASTRHRKSLKTSPVGKVGLAMPVTTPDYPDITQTRQVRTNYGFVANLEQAITADLGIFSRASWSPGRVELIGWTDCDQSLSFGAVLKGSAWGRPDDKIGVAGVVEGLSSIARAYFAAGGLGILIGDGQLNYRPERILEAYYAYSVNKWATFTFDYQFIDNPGYNADRGPVSVFSGRLHAQF